MGNDSSTNNHKQNERIRSQVLEQVSKLPMKERAFIRACSKADIVQIKSLIEQNVNPNIEGLTLCSPLHFVICSNENPNRTEVIKLLLRYEIYPLSCAKNGASPIHTVVAVQENNITALNLIDVLIYDEFSAKQLLMVDIDGNTPIHLASRLNRSSIVIKLLQLAQKYDCVECIKRTNVKGKTPLHLTQCTTTAQVLLNYDRECVNIQDKLGQTALHHAVAKKNLELTLVLLEYNAIPVIKDRSGFSANSLANISTAKYELDHILENNLALYAQRAKQNKEKEEQQNEYKKSLLLQQSQEPEKDRIQQLSEQIEELNNFHTLQLNILRIEYESKIKRLETKIDLILGNTSKDINNNKNETLVNGTISDSE